jgi:hypothetical protein
MPLPASRHPLARDVTVVVTLKLVFIALAAVFLFPKDERPVVNADVVARQLFGPPAMTEGKPPQ